MPENEEIELTFAARYYIVCNWVDNNDICPVIHIETARGAHR